MRAVNRLIENRSGGPRAGELPSFVASSKGSSAYQAHSYPTKIPPEAIVPFIEASTQQGAIVLDPFCGSGMTGVAALLSGRSAILSDLSPGAVHLARNYTAHIAQPRLLKALSNLDRSWMRRRERALYGVSCPTCNSRGITRHLIWSDVLGCPTCGADVVVGNAVDNDAGSVPRSVGCPECGGIVPRAGVRPLTSQPFRMVVECLGECQTLQTSPVTDEAMDRLCAVERRRLRHWVPTVQVEKTREMYKRSCLHLRDIDTIADFYLHRSKLALSELWSRINAVEDRIAREALRFAFTNTAWHSSRMRRFNARGGQRPLTGTLYIPQLVAEANVFEVFRHQVQQAAAFYATVDYPRGVSAVVGCSSATDLGWLPDQSVDYVFTDPPFGSNIFYGDCNMVWEAWLGGSTDTAREIVVNRSRTPQEGGKTVAEYGALLGDAFAEMRRVMRRGARASVVFHNSDDQVWAAMLEAAERAGLRQVEVSILDKGQRSMKGYRGRAGRELVPFYDLIITFALARVDAPELNGAGELALEATRKHLKEADWLSLPMTSPARSLEYLYSVAVGSVIRQGGKPIGLSLRAFESIASQNFWREGRHFATP